MHLGRSVFWLAAVGGGTTALGSPLSNAACTSSKVIDNFSGWTNKTNSLGSADEVFFGAADDKSMISIAAAAGSAITFTPKATAYFYENLACENVAGDGYNAISFTLSGPAQSSLLLEIQTKTNCSDKAYKSAWRNITVPTAASSTVTVPLKDFADSSLNLNGVTSLTWSTFNKTGSAYTLGNIQLVCGK